MAMHGIVVKLQKQHLLNVIGLAIGRMCGMLQCPANYILTGVNSIHHNHYEDRRWKFRCCHAENHFTKNCFASGYINDWNQLIDYSVDQPYVFTGVYSYHVNAKE